MLRLLSQRLARSLMLVSTSRLPIRFQQPPSSFSRFSVSFSTAPTDKSQQKQKQQPQQAGAKKQDKGEGQQKDKKQKGEKQDKDNANGEQKQQEKKAKVISVPPREEAVLNEKLQGEEFRVLDGEGKQLGILSREEALAAARSAELDLVLVTATAVPPVVRMVDYGKLLYATQQRQNNKSKEKSKQMSEKTIKLNSNIAPHDLQVKLKLVRGWLEDDNIVRFVLKDTIPDPLNTLFVDFVTHLGTGSECCVELSPAMMARLKKKLPVPTFRIVPQPKGNARLDVPEPNAQDYAEYLKSVGVQVGPKKGELAPKEGEPVIDEGQIADKLLEQRQNLEQQRVNRRKAAEKRAKQMSSSKRQVRLDRSKLEEAKERAGLEGEGQGENEESPRKRRG